MQHFRSFENVSIAGAWLTIGSFDGVHRGHQEIIHQMTAGAHQQGAPAVVLTFYPHPAVVLRGLRGPFYLTSPEERAERLGRLGVDAVITLAFDHKLAQTSAFDFMKTLTARLGLRALWVGCDFTLGRGREADLDRLRQIGLELGYTLYDVDPIRFEEGVISSTRIRQTLIEGDVRQAARLLGRAYAVQGPVIHGEGRGRTIGIPTANLAVWPEQILPAPGVYACRAWVNDSDWAAAVNLGVKPTFGDAAALSAAALSVEAHLLDFQGDLYGQSVRLEFIQRLRGEVKFPNFQALVAQIQQDMAAARQIAATG
jgi:riboflavin kinase/FMN adenylyltransferase